MALELWETFKESITAYTGLSPATFFTVLALGLALYYVVSNFFGSSDDIHIQKRSRGFEEQMQPLPPPVQLGEITEDELKQYDGSDSQKPLLMAIKSQVYDVSQSRMFYGPDGPYALFAGKDASRALAKMSFDEKDLNGDLTGLGVFELEALQDWEYKFMSKYVKVGTVVTTTVPVTDGTASTSSLASQICDHLASVFTASTTPYPPPLTVLVDEISATAARGGRVFLYGVGREGLMLRALCMRLFHLGLSAHFVFDMTTPPISQPDLLIASAGPGGFSTVDAICGVARSGGARVVLLTAQPELGSSVKYASAVAHVPAQTMADDGNGGNGQRSLLPMGSVYEGAMFVLFEMVVFKLGQLLNMSPEEVRSRHTNLE